MNSYQSKLPRALICATAILAFHLSAVKVAAQAGQPFADLDPQQIQQEIQQRVTTFFRERLVVTNDAEWSVIEKRLSKVIRAKAQTLVGGQGLGGAGLLGGRQGGDNPMARAVRSLLGLDEPMPETLALQKAIDARASTAELKAALAKFIEARKRKQAEMAAAQSELRQVLTFHQEATLILLGVLD